MSESPSSGATLHPGFRGTPGPAGHTIGLRSMIFRDDRGFGGLAAPPLAAERASQPTANTLATSIRKPIKRHFSKIFPKAPGAHRSFQLSAFRYARLSARGAGARGR